MEVLSDVLRSLRVDGSVYFCDRLDAPWSMSYGRSDRASFHFVRRGECWIGSDNVVERLGTGDLVFVAPGHAHVLCSSRPGTAEHASASALLLCGYCRFEAGSSHPLVRSLPGISVVGAQELKQHAWLRATLDQLSAEYRAQQAGSEVVVDKLTEVLVVELLRIDFGRTPKSGFFAALTDKPLARALSLLHSAPHRAWTLELLATEAGLSRAALAKRFKNRVGQPMFEYLSALRMHRAQELLRGGALPRHEIASRVGYDSELAFARAFKRLVGVTPSQYTRSHPVARTHLMKAATGQP